MKCLCKRKVVTGIFNYVINSTLTYLQKHATA